MKHFIFLLLIPFFMISCQSGFSVEDDLIGDWDYRYSWTANKPEVQMSFNVGVEFGVMTFRCDGTGDWDSRSASNNEMMWTIEPNELEITITKPKVS